MTIEYMKKDASLIEQVFGTPFCESKVEFWDAPLTNKVEALPDFAQKGWKPDLQTYVVRSVAINPKTGAAEQNKLYSFDVVPTGAEFEINIVGQNLTKAELGFLFFGIYAFNSEIYPLTLGALSGRGFGRQKFKLHQIYCLSNENIKDWVNSATSAKHAGYDIVEKLEPLSAEKSLKTFKSEFLQDLKELLK